MRLLPILILAAVLPLSADDQSDFSSAPDGTWQRYDPRALAALSPAVYDFSGNQCRIIAPQPLTEPEYYAALGLARAGLFAPTNFTNSVASVDITAWSPTTSRTTDGTFIGVFTRTQTPVAPMNLNGYTASIIDMGNGSGPGGVGRNGRLQLMRVNQENNYLPLTGYIDFLLDPARDYRLVLVSRGDNHTARLFDLTEPASPVAELSGQDATFATGKTGIMILTDRIPHAGGHFSIEATFDNFLAWDGSPPPLVIQPGSDPATVALSSDLHRSMASDLQSTTNFTDPLTPWLPATPASTSAAGGQFVTVFPIDGPNRFFRRKSL